MKWSDQLPLDSVREFPYEISIRFSYFEFLSGSKSLCFESSEFQRRRVRFTFYYLLRTFVHSLVDSLMNLYFTFVSLSLDIFFFSWKTRNTEIVVNLYRILKPNILRYIYIYILMISVGIYPLTINKFQW